MQTRQPAEYTPAAHFRCMVDWVTGQSGFDFSSCRIQKPVSWRKNAVFVGFKVGSFGFVRDDPSPISRNRPPLSAGGDSRRPHEMIHPKHTRTTGVCQVNFRDWVLEIYTRIYCAGLGLCLSPGGVIGMIGGPISLYTLPLPECLMIFTLAQVSSDGVDTSLIAINTLMLLARYLHIVSMTLLVGGTLFFEMVVPIAIADMKEEQQLAIFGRARWVFRRIVWTAAVVVMVTGVLSAVRHWEAYSQPEIVAEKYTRATTTQPATQPVEQFTPAVHPGWWWLSHVGAGSLSIAIAFFLTVGRTPPANPVRWMRINLVVLMIVIFLGSATRHVRIATTEPSPRDLPAIPR